jgi:hypothetical protein
MTGPEPSAVVPEPPRLTLLGKVMGALLRADLNRLDHEATADEVLDALGIGAAERVGLPVGQVEDSDAESSDPRGSDRSPIPRDTEALTLDCACSPENGYVDHDDCPIAVRAALAAT